MPEVEDSELRRREEILVPSVYPEQCRGEVEGKDLDNIQPINYAVPAKPHTPVYKMHRYFARRPHNVFAELIKHYSNPGCTMLDALCGSSPPYRNANQSNSGKRLPEAHLSRQLWGLREEFNGSKARR